MSGHPSAPNHNLGRLSQHLHRFLALLKLGFQHRRQHIIEIPTPIGQLKRPYEIAMNCWKKGFYVRYGGDTIQMAPPFISTPAEIDRLVSALGDALAEVA